MPVPHREDRAVLGQPQRERLLLLRLPGPGRRLRLRHAEGAGRLPTAVERLAGKAGVTLRYTDRNEGESRKRRAKLVDTMARAGLVPRALLRARRRRRPQLPARAGARRRRGGDSRSAGRPTPGTRLTRALRLDKDLGEGTGLARANSRGRLNDHFRARILFPIYDDRGDPISFGGRILPGGRPRATRASTRTRPRRRSTTSPRCCTGSTGPRPRSSRPARPSSARATPTSSASTVPACPWPWPPAARRSPTSTSGCSRCRPASRPRLRRRRRRPGGGRALLPVGARVRPAGGRRRPAAGPGPGRRGPVRPRPAQGRGRRRHALPALPPRPGLRRRRPGQQRGAARAAERALEIVAEHPTDLVRDQYLMDVVALPGRAGPPAHPARPRASPSARRHPRRGRAAAARVAVALASRPVRAGRGHDDGASRRNGSAWSRARGRGALVLGRHRRAVVENRPDGGGADGSGPASPADRATSGGDRSRPGRRGITEPARTARRSRCCGTPCTTPAPSPGGWARSCSTIPSSWVLPGAAGGRHPRRRWPRPGPRWPICWPACWSPSPSRRPSTPCACCTWRWPAERSPRCDWRPHRRRRHPRADRPGDADTDHRRPAQRSNRGRIGRPVASLAGRPGSRRG